jgi:phosphonate transport system substrate-binding protein
MSATVGLVSAAVAADATWPKEITFALLSTENAAEITRRWTPILAQLEKDLGIKVRSTAATDYRGTIEALKFKKAEMRISAKSYVEASTGTTPMSGRSPSSSSPMARSATAPASSCMRSPTSSAPRTSPAGPSPSMTQLDLGVSRAVGVLSDGDGRRSEEALLQADVLGLARGIDPRRGQQEGRGASTNLGDLQQLTREGKVPRGGLRVVWVSKLIPNDPIVVRKDLPASLRSAIQESLTTMRARNPEVFKEAGATIGGFVPADDGKYQVIRDLNETAKRLAAQK